MRLHELPRTTTDRKRVGRSISAGGGKTAGRGTKGQKSRTGKKLRYSFEGGQMPLTQRLPKRRGFRRISPKPVSISVDRLVRQGLTTVNPGTLKEAGLIENEKVAVKIIAGTSEPTKKLIYSDVKLSGSLAPKQPAKSQTAAEGEESE